MPTMGINVFGLKLDHEGEKRDRLGGDAGTRKVCFLF